MAKFHYYLKNTGAEGETVIFLSIHSNKRRIKFYTEKSINPKFWNTKTQKAFKVTHAPELNTSLDSIKNEAEKIALRLFAELHSEPEPEQIRDELITFLKIQKVKNRLSIELGKEPTPDQLKKGLENEGFNNESKPIKNDFISFFAHVTEQTKIRSNSKTGKPLAATTTKAFERTLCVLKEFKTAKKFKLEYETIDMDFYYNFKNYLEKDLGFSVNTIGKHIKQIKVILNEATELGHNTYHKYKNKKFEIVKEEIPNIYLNELELMDLQKLDLSKNKRLAKVRDLFIIGSWTGLRFSDFSRLTRDNIFTDNEGNQNFKIKTLKTDIEVDIPILPPTMAVLNLYGGPDNLQLPESISNQKMNEYLKEIGEMVDSLNVPFNKDRTTGGMKISTNKMKWKYLSTHAARRSFSTNMFERGIPVQNIMSITGHKTEQDFYKYIKMSPTNKAKLFRDEFYKTNKPNLKIAQ